jgi:peptide/nickel transport system permease protein
MAYIPLIVVVVSFLTFFVLRLPWSRDPATVYINQSTTPEQEAAIRADLGIDKPAAEQFVIWMGDVLTGDMGRTFRGDQPVVKEIQRRLPVTLEILILSVVFSTIIGVPLGILCAVKQNTWIDYLCRFLVVFGQSVPAFFLLILLIVLPSIWWNYSPPIGGHVSIFDDPLENLRLYVPPTLLLSAAGAAGMIRITRSTMLEVFRQDYMRTARAKGLGGRSVVFSHALRNSLIPIVTIIGAEITLLLFGSLILNRSSASTESASSSSSPRLWRTSPWFSSLSSTPPSS